MPRDYVNDPPSSSGSSGSLGDPSRSSAGPPNGNGLRNLDWDHHHHSGVSGTTFHWEGVGQNAQGDWREHGQGTGVA